MQSECLAVFFEWPARVQRAAAYQQSAVEAPEPIQPVAIRRARRGDAGERMPGERLAKEFGIGNIKAAIDDHFVAQTTAGVYPSDAHTAAGAIVEHRGFNSAQLRWIQHLRVRE